MLIRVCGNFHFPYVGIIQIRLQVEAIQLTLSLLFESSLFLILNIVHYYTIHGYCQDFSL